MESGNKLEFIGRPYCGGVSMIVREHYKTRTDGVELYRTYSDAGYLIRQAETGAEYDEAIDVDGAPHTYTETGKLVTDNFDIETASLEQLRERLIDTETAAKILLGHEKCARTSNRRQALWTIKQSASRRSSWGR